MSIPRILLGAALVATLSMPLVGQQEQPAGYHSIACVKVNPGKWDAFQEWIKGPGHMLDQELIDSGRASSSLVLRTVMPQGTASDCDYVFVTFYNGLPAAPLGTQEMAEALHKAGLSMTPDEFYARRGELGTLVSDNITRYQTLVGRAKPGDYLVFNSMSASDIGACLAYQKKMWQPLAEEMVKAGKTDGWAINVQVFPSGARDRNLVSSVDIYPSWDAVFSSRDSISSGWKKVHPDADIETTMGQFEKLCTIEHTVLYRVEGIDVPKR